MSDHQADISAQIVRIREHKRQHFVVKTKRGFRFCNSYLIVSSTRSRCNTPEEGIRIDTNRTDSLPAAASSVWNRICWTFRLTQNRARFNDPGDLMKLDEEELDQSYFQSVRKGTDKTIGYIFVCLIVTFFFSLYLIGMQRVQTVSDQVVSDHSRPDSRPVSEIGDPVDNLNR